MQIGLCQRFCLNGQFLGVTSGPAHSGDPCTEDEERTEGNNNLGFFG